MHVCLSGFNLLLLISYFPCYDNSSEYFCELSDCLGFLQNCIEDSDADGIILLCDFNFECVDTHRGYNLFKELLNKSNLVNCDLVCTKKFNYTYYQEASGKQSKIDHIFVSNSMIGMMENYRVYDDACNMSDHYPVFCSIGGVLNKMAKKTINSSNSRQMLGIRRWDKANLLEYYLSTGKLFQNLPVPFDLLSCECNTSHCLHWRAINEYYNLIVQSLTVASEWHVPLIRSGVLKPYWSAELQDLK